MPGLCAYLVASIGSARLHQWQVGRDEKPLALDRAAAGTTSASDAVAHNREIFPRFTTFFMGRQRACSSAHLGYHWMHGCADEKRLAA